MSTKIISYDLGTSGVKVVLYEEDGTLLESVDRPYKTYYPQIGWHEQKPFDWWNEIINGTRQLFAQSEVDVNSVAYIGLTGHYFGVVPVDNQGNLLRSSTPIWSDNRANEQSERFLERVGHDHWYQITGSSSSNCFAIFKIMWYIDNEPDMIKRTHKILGTKDYIIFRLTGKFVTDHSYASGSGVYDLRTNQYSSELIDASGVSKKLLPEIVPSTVIVGELTHDAANELGLNRNVKVTCGGGDTPCIVLGAKGIEDGRALTSLGSSAWIEVTSKNPLFGKNQFPNVFAHVIPGMYCSTLNLHSAGNAFRWARDVFCEDLVKAGKDKQIDPYKLMTELAGMSPVGANKLIFNPTLAMGGQLDSSIHTKGTLTGLDLKHTREDILRAVMEGITLSLGTYLEELKKLYSLNEDMLLVGGGSNSSLWRQIFADIFNMRIIKTNVGQNAGALGAAAIAAVGAGLWKDFTVIDSLHQIEDIKKPIAENAAKYREFMSIYKYVADCQAEIGEMLYELN